MQKEDERQESSFEDVYDQFEPHQLSGKDFDPTSSFSYAWSNINLACHRSIQSISQIATNIAYNAKHSNCPLVQRKQIQLKNSQPPVYMLGKKYDYENRHTFLWAFRNIIWLSYRSNSETEDSDAGWGCMIRVCQMLLAEILKKNQHQLQLSDILNMFIDSEEGLFCLKRICDEGNIYNRWTSSTEILLLLKSILSSQSKIKLQIEIYNSVISMNDIKNQTYPLLVTVSNRLGEKQIPELFFPHIISLIDHPNFAGMVGGIGGEAIYIVGHQDQQLIILDPHYIQSQNQSNTIYFKKTPRGVPLKKISCSVTFCFYFTSKDEHVKWVKDVAQTCIACSPNLAIEMTTEELQSFSSLDNAEVIDSDEEFQILI